MEGVYGESYKQFSDALGELYEEHRPKLRRRSHWLANGNVEEAEDLLHDTFLRALTYPSEPGAIINLLGYLFRVMRHVWIDKQKKVNRLRMESLDAIQSDPARQGEIPRVEPEVLRLAENEELLNELRLKQGPLTSDEKFLLGSLLAGETLEMIAAMLGEDPCRTKVRWNALKAKLRARIKSCNAKTKGTGHS